MTVRPSLIQAERVDWASLRCGCGNTGAHIPETFASLLVADSPQEMADAPLEGHVYVELISCVGGESHWTEVEAGAPEIEIDCRIAAREGVWMAYQEYATGRASMARMILDAVDADCERFDYFDAKLIDLVRKRSKDH